MDIRQLEYLAALAEERHFTRAANRCNVTQPTLSGRIRQLEEQLGVPIVQRGHRYHGLTREGEHVLRWARVIIDNRTALMQELSGLKGGLAGRLTLGVIPSALPMVSSVTTAVRDKHPGITFTVCSQASQDLLRDIGEFRIDAGITYLDNEPLGHSDELVTEPLYVESYRLFIPSDHPWAERESVSWHDASSLPLILLTPDMQNRRIVDGAFLHANSLPISEIETNSVITLWSHVRFRGWASVMPAYFEGLFGADSGVVGLPLVEPDVEQQVGLVTLQRDPIPPLIEALREACHHRLEW